jgi:hypothetical protein
MYIQITNKNFQKLVHVCSKNLCHSFGEGRGSTFHVERHDNPIKQPRFGTQSKFVDVLWNHLDLPES